MKVQIMFKCFLNNQVVILGNTLFLLLMKENCSYTKFLYETAY